MVLSLTSCAGSGKVTDVEICLEIPFIDGAEGACTTTVSRKSKLYRTEDWSKMRPYMLMLHADGWTEIKKDWLKACRLNKKKCNVQIQSIDDAVQALDKILKTMKGTN